MGDSAFYNLFDACAEFKSVFGMGRGGKKKNGADARYENLKQLLQSRSQQRIAFVMMVHVRSRSSGSFVRLAYLNVENETKRRGGRKTWNVLRVRHDERWLWFFSFFYFSNV